MAKGLYVQKLLIQVKINMWHVNFKEKQAQYVNLWSIVKPDLPPKMYVTNSFSLSFSEYLKISLPGTLHLKREIWNFPFKFLVHVMLFKVLVKHEFF